MIYNYITHKGMIPYELWSRRGGRYSNSPICNENCLGSRMLRNWPPTTASTGIYTVILLSRKVKEKVTPVFSSRAMASCKQLWINVEGWSFTRGSLAGWGMFVQYNLLLLVGESSMESNSMGCTPRYLEISSRSIQVIEATFSTKNLQQTPAWKGQLPSKTKKTIWIKTVVSKHQIWFYILPEL